MTDKQPEAQGYGIWTTDMEGKRVMGFTPEQFLSVWQAHADLEAENAKLREALTTCKHEAGVPERVWKTASTALKEQP